RAVRQRLPDDVPGLEIAVDDVVPVEVDERGGDVRAELDRLFHAERARPEDPRERVTLDELHHEDEPVFGVLDEIEDARHVVAADLSEEYGLAPEPRHDLVARRGGREKLLERDFDADGEVLARIHCPHAARADASFGSVAPGDDGSGFDGGPGGTAVQ